VELEDLALTQQHGFLAGYEVRGRDRGRGKQARSLIRCRGTTQLPQGGPWVYIGAMGRGLGTMPCAARRKKPTALPRGLPQHQREIGWDPDTCGAMGLPAPPSSMAQHRPSTGPARAHHGPSTAQQQQTHITTLHEWCGAAGGGLDGSLGPSTEPAWTTQHVPARYCDIK
jgi:hypothetical protein